MQKVNDMLDQLSKKEKIPPGEEFSNNLENLKDNKSFAEDASDSNFSAERRKVEEIENELAEDVADSINETIEPGPEVRAASDYLDEETESAAEVRAASDYSDEETDIVAEERAAFDYLGEETDIVGLEDERQELFRLISAVSDLYFLIAVVGKAGSGKTTLVSTVYKSRVSKNFDCCAWVSVSQFFRERDVLLQILEQVAEIEDVGELSVEVLRSKLRRILFRKSYLIVLDDVHQSKVWDNLKLALPNSLSGSRVILTVRDIKEVYDFKPSVVQLYPLSNGESWKLFSKTVIQDTSNSEVRNLKEKILQKCQGLPYTIRMLGGLLSTKELDKWSSTIDQTNDQSASSDLSSPLRACLLYLCLFGKPSQINVRRLFLLWLAEGLASEDLMLKYLKELKKRKMIDIKKRRSNGRPKSCSVPSTLYDNLFPNAVNLGFFHIHVSSDSPSNSPKHNIRRLAEHSDIQSNPPSEKYFQLLRSYISFNIRMGDKPTDEVGKFLQTAVIKGGYGLLTVLDLEGVYKPMLPEKLGKLTMLRYIGLRRTFLDIIPESIGDFLHLETLDVKYTNITTLPISIWNAKKLRHLYMDGIYFKRSIHRSFPGGSLANLQTLTGLWIGNNDPPINWLTGLTGLRKLALTCHTEPLPDITKWICTLLLNLESLKLRATNEHGEPSKLDLGSMKNHEKLRDLYLVGELPTSFSLHDLPPNLKFLTLSVSKLSNDPMEALGKLKKLKILRLFANSYTGKEITCPKNGFPHLRVLKLWMLKELNKFSIDEGSMPVLEKLEIRCCKELQNIEGLQNVNMSNLKKLILTNMKNEFLDEVERSMDNIVKRKEFKFKPSWD